MPSGPYTDNVVVSVGANAQSAIQNLSSNFTNQPRHLLGVFMGNTTAGLQLIVLKLGRPLAILDGSLFSATAGFIDIEDDWPLGFPITVQLNNTTGGAINNVAVAVKFLALP